MVAGRGHRTPPKHDQGDLHLPQAGRKGLTTRARLCRVYLQMLTLSIESAGPGRSTGGQSCAWMFWSIFNFRDTTAA